MTQNIVPHCRSAFSEPGLWWCALCFYHSSFLCMPCTPPGFPSSRPHCAGCTYLFVVFLLLSLASPRGQGLVFPFWYVLIEHLTPLPNVRGMNECMHLEHKFPPSWSWTFLHEAGPPCTKDIPHSRFNAERIGFYRMSPFGGSLLPGHCNAQCLSPHCSWIWGLLGEDFIFVPSQHPVPNYFQPISAR